MKYFSVIIVGSILVLGFFLRTYKVDTDPPGLYLDEVSIGLNAYDVLTTGKDQHDKVHPLFFAAYGEYKMPVYIYLVSGAMYFLGKTDFAIRFPSIFFGTLTIGVIFLLFKEILENELKKEKTVTTLSTVGALLLATSPWHLQFSRAGFEATVALFFYSLSLLMFVYCFKQKKLFYFLLASICLVITFYTYDGYRLLVPLTVVVSWFVCWNMKKNRIGIGIISAFLLLALLPLIFFTFTQGGLMRLSQTSAFSQYHFANYWEQVLANSTVYVKNYFSFFSITYLFRFGDQINRHQVEGFGLLYIWQLPYIIFGLAIIPKLKTKILIYGLLFLLFATPLAAALAVPSPHTLRFLLAVIPFTFLTVIGLYRVSQLLQKRKIFRIGIFLVTFIFALIQCGYYIDYYYVHYSKNALYDWGGECKEVAQKAESLSKHFDTILVDGNLLCVSEYFSFYAPHLNVQFVNPNQIPLTTRNQRVLLIKQKNKEIPQGQVIENIYLPNLNHDVFAEFWKL